MIQTTFISLATVARMLETDPDAVLVAALERRLRLYWLFNQTVAAERGMYEDMGYDLDGEPSSSWVPHEYSRRHFTYIPLGSCGAGDLLKFGTITASAGVLSDEGKDGTYWTLTDVIGMTHYPPPTEDVRRVTRDTVFARRVDIEAILTQGATPDAGAVTDLEPEKAKCAVSRTHHTLLYIIAALADQAGLDLTERGAAVRVAEWTQLTGAAVSADTVRKYLDMIPDAMERRRA